MASRKRKPDLQLGLSLPATAPIAAPPAMPASSSVDSGQGVDPASLEDFDDYDELEEVEPGIPRLRLVDPLAPMPRVIVELVDEGPKGQTFEVSRLRSNGNTVASVMWTRDELEELIDRVRAALEVAK